VLVLGCVPAAFLLAAPAARAYSTDPHIAAFVEVFANGTSAEIQIDGGAPIAVDTGNITFSITDDANGEFVSFAVSSIKGPRPAGPCDAIVATLS